MPERTPDGTSSLLEGHCGRFEVTVTKEILQQASDSSCTIQGVQQFRKLRAELDRFLKRRKKFRNLGMISLVVFLNVTALTASIVFFSTGDTNGGYFWGALFLLIFTALLTLVFDKQLRRFMVALMQRRLRTHESLNKRSAEHSYDTYQDKTPYTVTYQLEEHTWSSASEPGGRKTVELNPDMIVLHNRCSYILFKSDLSDQWMIGLVTQDDDQRSQIEANLAANGIPLYPSDEFDLDLNQLAE